MHPSALRMSQDVTAISAEAEALDALPHDPAPPVAAAGDAAASAAGHALSNDGHDAAAEHQDLAQRELSLQHAAAHQDRQQPGDQQAPPAAPAATGARRESADHATPLRPASTAHQRMPLHARTMSGLSVPSMTPDDFEHTAEPLASSGFGDQESMLPVTAALSFKVTLPS